MVLRNPQIVLVHFLVLKMLKLFVKTFKFPQLFNAVFLERDRVTVSGLTRSAPTDDGAFFGLWHWADRGRPLREVLCLLPG